jgi:hypothetical protein
MVRCSPCASPWVWPSARRPAAPGRQPGPGYGPGAWGALGAVARSEVDRVPHRTGQGGGPVVAHVGNHAPCHELGRQFRGAGRSYSGAKRPAQGRSSRTLVDPCSRSRLSVRARLGFVRMAGWPPTPTSNNDIPRRKPDAGLGRRTFAQVRRGSNIQLLPYSLVGDRCSG